MSKLLKFADNDLVYGPSALGALYMWQQKFGGKLLGDISKHDTTDDGFTWYKRSKMAINTCVNMGFKIRFDLTNMSNISGILINKGTHSGSETAKELRYIMKEWDRLKDSVVFYINNVEVDAPWLN